MSFQTSCPAQQENIPWPTTIFPLFLQALLKPERYDHPAPDVKLVQTHISSVILAGDFVYKFKKPVNFGFLDFSDLEKRRVCCEQEVLLNRRLCPDIYLGMVEVTARAGWALCLEREGGGCGVRGQDGENAGRADDGPSHSFGRTGCGTCGCSGKGTGRFLPAGRWRRRNYPIRHSRRSRRQCSGEFRPDPRALLARGP